MKRLWNVWGVGGAKHELVKAGQLPDGEWPHRAKAACHTAAGEDGGWCVVVLADDESVAAACDGDQAVLGREPVLLTAGTLRAALAGMPDDAVVHLCAEGVPYLPLAGVLHEPNDDGEPPGVVILGVTRDSHGLFDEPRIRALMEELVDERNYVEETIAHEIGKEVLGIMDGRSS